MISNQELIGGIIIIIVILFLLIGVLPFWMIFRKTGQSGAISLLLLIPLVNVVVLFYLAFAEWPIERELFQLRRMRQDVPRK